MLNKKKIISILTVALSLNAISFGGVVNDSNIVKAAGTSYYVSATGSDKNAGTSSTAAFQTISKAVSVAAPGATIYVASGTYKLSAPITLDKSGSSTAPISIVGTGTTRPVLDFSGEGTGVSSYGFYITGNYWNIKGLEVKNAAGKGLRILGSYNTFDNIASHNNRDSGFFIGLNKTDANDGTKAAYNKVINCDSYLNFDQGGSTGDGGNADGFSCKLHPGNGNVFTGCRAWENSDDGWDLYMADYPVTVLNSYTWHNGDPKSFAYTGSSWGGNGSGFKMGGGQSTGAHVLKNCVAFDINYGKNTNHKAFDQNGANGNITGVSMYNCLAFNSHWGFYFADKPTTGKHLVENCVSINTTGGAFKLDSTAINTNNSWNTAGVVANAADFLDLTTASAQAPRNADGSLAKNNFARLNTSSDLIDKGIKISGMSYFGAAPDLGAYECK